jgi:multidrug resistance efflux pump
MTRVQPVRRLRFALFFVGVVVMIGSLLGARALTGSHEEKAKAESPGAASPTIVGPVVLGTVDSNPQPISYGLPPVLQSGTIEKRFVKDGDEIHAGDALYSFDTSSLRRTLEVAERAVDVARTKVSEARESESQHLAKVDIQEVAVKIAEQKKTLQMEYYELIKTNLKNYYKSQEILETQWDANLRKDDKLFAAHVALETASSELQLKQKELNVMREGAKMAKIMVEQAEAGVEQAKAQVASARNAIELCTLRAKIDGSIEQVTISEGTTLGISTPKPALWLIPAGPRIVRAEIEAEFAHRVSSSLLGKEVTIYDNTDPKLTYRGKIRLISDAFLLKRSSEGILGSDTRVLEAQIDVIDAKPANRPPLRIGQRVRVDMGQ